MVPTLEYTSSSQIIFSSSYTTILLLYLTANETDHPVAKPMFFLLRNESITIEQLHI
jgi:DNA phosphorothioation-dependent restriction protein DptG